MLDPWLLRTFLEVASRLSFREAALALHLAPSTVTGQIKTLEEELSVVLFDRSTRQVLLTEQGQLLVHHARRILDLEAQARRSLAGEDEASLGLAVRLSESLGIYALPGLLTRFRRRFPLARLTVTTYSQHGLLHDLRHGAVDLAMILGEPFAAPGIEMQVLGREKLVVVAAPDAPQAGLGRVGPQDLSGAPLVVTPHMWSARAAVERALMLAQAEPGPVVECTSVEIVKRCVMAGLGLSVVPELTVRSEVASGLLVALEWTQARLSTPVLLLRDSGRWLSASAQGFMAAAGEVFTAG